MLLHCYSSYILSAFFHSGALFSAASELDKPCITNNYGFLFAIFGDETDIGSIKSDIENTGAGNGGRFVILNPSYFNKSISKAAPQFISVELRIQDTSAFALKAYNDFKANLNLDKL